MLSFFFLGVLLWLCMFLIFLSMVSVIGIILSVFFVSVLYFYFSFLHSFPNSEGFSLASFCFISRQNLSFLF